MSNGLPVIYAVDDKETNLRLLRAYLQGEPYSVVTFTNAKEALETIEAAPPDLVLLDLMMPVIDGFAALEVLRESAPQVPVLVVTATDDRDARLRGLAAGARDFLTKPLDRSELLIRVRNLVALKQSTDALEQAMSDLRLANRDLQSFAGTLAHDLQQPITTINSFAQVMQSQAGGLTPASAGHLAKIIAACDAARGMIKALLEFARLGQAQVRKEDVDLNHVLADAREIVTNGGDSPAVEWKIGTLPVVQGDPSLLKLAFVNLLSNAVKYSRKQATPQVSVTAILLAHNGHAIQVHDNGVGFDMAHAGKLFNPFERLHTVSEFEGTGMGLANVRRIMEKHGGTVKAESQVGHGATFTLVLR
ncbi:sensor histidine kinase [Ramlibacter sp. PS4R-6]|uniref:sensor histidine kinase n=1 Tax=Ramlibacter sp. PS4R-6 TaxID=3133438 RepID=UPI0030B7AE7D